MSSHITDSPFITTHQRLTIHLNTSQTHHSSPHVTPSPHILLPQSKAVTEEDVRLQVTVETLAGDNIKLLDEITALQNSMPGTFTQGILNPWEGLIVI